MTMASLPRSRPGEDARSGYGRPHQRPDPHEMLEELAPNGETEYILDKINNMTEDDALDIIREGEKHIVPQMFASCAGWYIQRPDPGMASGITPGIRRRSRELERIHCLGNLTNSIIY